jgi:hypothetical protein
MRQFWIVLGLVTAFTAGALVAFTGRSSTHAAETTDVKWSSKMSGSIPKTWGDLVGVGTISTQTVLVFKDNTGTLRRVLWNANGSLTGLVHVLERHF